MDRELSGIRLDSRVPCHILPIGNASEDHLASGSNRIPTGSKFRFDDDRYTLWSQHFLGRAAGLCFPELDLTGSGRNTENVSTIMRELESMEVRALLGKAQLACIQVP